MDAASAHGQVAVLDWWVENAWKLHPKATFESRSSCSWHAMDRASANRHFHVLEWWKSSGLLKLPYTDAAMDTLDRDVLLWWKMSGLHFYWSPSIHRAFSAGDLDFILWLEGLAKAHIETDPSARRLNAHHFWYAPEFASQNGHLHMLDWYKASDYVRDMGPYTHNGNLIRATRGGRVDVLEWWKDSGLLYSLPDRKNWLVPECVKEACLFDRANVLDWFADSSGCDMSCADDHDLMDIASQNGSASVLQWFKDRGASVGIPVVWSRSSMNNAWDTKVLNWWRDSGLECRWDWDRVTAGYSYRESAEVRQWWKAFAGIPDTKDSQSL